MESFLSSHRIGLEVERLKSSSFSISEVKDLSLLSAIEERCAIMEILKESRKYHSYVVSNLHDRKHWLEGFICDSVVELVKSEKIVL